MTSFSSSTTYPSSTLAYPHLNQMLDSLLGARVSSTLSIFTLCPRPPSILLLCLQVRCLPLRCCLPSRRCFPVRHNLQFLRLFHYCHMMLVLLHPIPNKFLQFVSWLAICNNASNTTRNAHSWHQVKLDCRPRKYFTQLCINRHSLGITML